MGLREKGKTAGVKFSYIGSFFGFLIGLVLSYICSHFLLVLITPLAGYFLYDRPKYAQKVDKVLTEKKRQEEQALQEQEEARLKEEKKVQRQIKAVQKKNRENKASLYENIYTVAGYILANVEDLEVYVENAEDVIAHFKASKEERVLAVEAFNMALNPEFNVDEFIADYLLYIGKNRDYISYVLNYALMIATYEDNILDEVRERLNYIGKALGASQAALKRLFKSNGAEARFARDFENEQYERLSGDGSSAKSSGKGKGRRSSGNANSGAKRGSKTQEALEILQLTSKATLDDIKKAYKKVMLKYHPDRLAAQNLSEDMVAIYTDKAKAIQGAFDYLKKLYSDYT